MEEDLSPIVAKPVSVTVFGILNIVFGALGILSIPIGIIMLFVTSEQMDINPGCKTWLIAFNFISFGFAIWLLIVGIGLLKLKNWARTGSVIYGWCAIVLGILGTCIQIIAINAGWLGDTEQALPGIIGGIVGGLIGLIYPALLIIFMSKGNVKQAFGIQTEADAAEVLRP